MTVVGKKEQFMALVDGDQLRDMDALRVIAWVSRAEINRRLLDIALPQAMAEHLAELARLDKVAEKAGVVDRDYFVRQLVAGRQRVPKLDELEQMNRTQLRALLKN